MSQLSHLARNDHRSNEFPRSTTRIDPRFGLSAAARGRSFRYSLLLGIIAGLAFSMALWAYEAILLFQAHVAYAWIPVVVGSVLAMLICMSAGILTWIFNRALLGLVFWVIAARLVASLALDIPLRIAPRLMILFEPGLSSRFPAYPMTSTFQTWGWFGTIWLAIFFGILGLLQITLVEQAVPATTSGGRLFPYVVFVPVMLIASFMSSNMINEQLRAPFIETDSAIQFVLDNPNMSVTSTLAREKHYGTIQTLSPVLDQPRRLFLGKYDNSYYQVDILIDFNGTWADCNTANTQPVYCRLDSSQ
jgi:hypothetical protein